MSNVLKSSEEFATILKLGIVYFFWFI